MCERERESGGGGGLPVCFAHTLCMLCHTPLSPPPPPLLPVCAVGVKEMREVVCLLVCKIRVAGGGGGGGGESVGEMSSRVLGEGRGGISG